ncbi:TonB-dependent receptor, partial [bacterium]|nr:TonB-dependent receptor [bacterium]
DLKSYYFAGGYYGDKTTLKFVTFGGHEKTYQAWYGVIADSLKTNRTYNELGSYTDANGNTKFYDNQVDDYTQTHYQLHWSQRLNQNLHLNATAHYGITYALNYETKKINATIGGALNRYDGDHFGKVIWVRNAQNLQPNHEYYRSNSLKDEFNIYAKATAEVFSDLFATVDLQYRHINYSLNGRSDKFNSNTNLMDDISNVYVFDFFNPKVGLTYQLNSSNSFYGSYSIANREPNRSNYTDNSSAAEPKPERLYDTEIGYRFQSSRFSAGANLYYMNYKDQLILTGKLSEIGEMLTSNISDSYR